MTHNRTIYLETLHEKPQLTIGDVLGAFVLSRKRKNLQRRINARSFPVPGEITFIGTISWINNRSPGPGGNNCYEICLIEYGAETFLVNPGLYRGLFNDT